LTPTSGCVGTQIVLSISSSSFPIDGDYQIRWSPTASFEEDETLILKTGTVPKYGYSLTETLTVPEGYNGRYYVQFLRIARNDPVTMQFILRPCISISQSSVNPGDTVNLDFKGFPANDSGSLYFDSNVTGIHISPNNVGSYKAQFSLPDTTCGTHTFIAKTSDLGNEAVKASLEVVPDIVLNPKTVLVNESFTITGRGFSGDSSVSVKCNEDAIANSPTTSSSGKFAYECSLPTKSPGIYTITAADEYGNKAKATLTVQTKDTPPPPGVPEEPEPTPQTLEPPPRPTVVAPRDQQFGLLTTEAITFHWEKVAYSGEVTYTVEVSEDCNFLMVQPGMRKSGLTQTSYILNVKPGTYYWRVRAVGADGTKGDWTYSPYSFQVGLVSIDNLVACGFVILLAAIFLILIIMLIKAFYRRLHEYY
jgi:hypothetical protein